MSSDRYAVAVSDIPKGQTRSFAELAALAGRPGAARAVGRALARYQWRGAHRVVDWRGRPRDSRALARLRREGARPRERESVREWAERTGAGLIGHYPSRRMREPSEEGVARWNPLEVEALAGRAAASARGFLAPGESATNEVPLPNRAPLPPRRTTKTLRARFDELDWESARRDLDECGVHALPGLLTPRECRSILNHSCSSERFERRVDMLARGYGVGSYHYYREPIPAPARALRQRLYRELAPEGYEEGLESFWSRCRGNGQKRASSILIAYPTAGINHPHRDVYGPVAFPYQALVMLTKQGRDFTGGDFYVSDEDGLGQTTVVPVSEGDVVLFATRDRRPRGSRSRVAMRHGMREVTRGTRYGLGIVFHLAE